ncbi:MAG: ABC transporter permease [Phycisphaerales bacterium]|nr:MAG: ABC transporter permease [Phycisphaerales bacterium]
MLLALPFILVGMPARAQAAGIVMVILFTGFFGTAVAHVHLREDRYLERLMLLPVSRASLTLDLVLASIVSRFVPTALVLGAFVIVNGRVVSGGELIVLAGQLCATLLLLTLLGMGIAWLARSNAEVHLFGALTVGLIAAVSGVMPAPQRLAPMTAALAWNPIGRLVAVLVGLSDEKVGISPTEIGFASLILVATMAALTIRWVQGDGRKTEGSDSPEAMAHNAAARVKEGQG